MPRCEKCGYTRATADWCTSCGSKNPYPKKMWFLRGLLAASLILILVTGTFFARWVAAERIARVLSGNRLH